MSLVLEKFGVLAGERIIKSEEHGWSDEVVEDKSKSATPVSE